MLSRLHKTPNHMQVPILNMTLVKSMITCTLFFGASIYQVGLWSDQINKVRNDLRLCI